MSIAHKRLILRFTCWNSFGPADMDHDAAHFNAQVALGANDAPTHAFIAFFYWRGRPFAQAGTSQSFNPQVRYGRPNSHSIQLSVPLSTFGHPIHLWVLPSARGNREDIAPQLNIKVPK